MKRETRKGLRTWDVVVTLVFGVIGGRAAKAHRLAQVLAVVVVVPGVGAEVADSGVFEHVVDGGVTVRLNRRHGVEEVKNKWGLVVVKELECQT